MTPKWHYCALPIQNCNESHVRPTLFTHRRSVAERRGCFQRGVCLFVALSVCQFFCVFINTTTSERRMMKLGGWVHGTKISPDFECQLQKSKAKVTRDKNEKSAAFCWGVVLLCAVLVQHFSREQSSGARSTTPVGKSAPAV